MNATPASPPAPSTPPEDPGRRRFMSLTAGFAAAASAPALGAAQGASGTPAASPAAGDVLDVIIVGAGLSGLTAARDLRRAGCESFAVLEANARVGGRTLNHDLGSGRFSEAGGQWIGPGQTAIADLARQLGVGTFPTYYQGETVLLAGSGKLAMDLDGSFGTDPKLAAKLNALARDVPAGAPWRAARAAELDAQSVGDWLAQQKLSASDQIGWNMTVLLTCGTAPAKMGLLHFLSMINSASGRYEELDSIKHSAQETRIEGGSQILSLKMAAALGNKLHLSTPVRAIQGWNGPVLTLDTDRGPLQARRVILAIPPSSCQRIAFGPELPAARRALQRHWPAYSPGRKTAHVYARPFWRDKGLSGHILQAEGPVIWAYDNSPADASIGVINAFVMQAALPAEATKAGPILADIYARALGDEARRPLQFHDQDWGREPWIPSCVSAIPPGFWTRHGEALHPPVGGLIWSGTETAEIWAGYMDGAVRSGQRAALQVLQSLRQPG